MSNTLSDKLEKVMEWRTKIYRGVPIEFTSHGYLVFGKMFDTLPEAHYEVDKSYNALQNSIKK
jgi:hypothetical protein